MQSSLSTRLRAFAAGAAQPTVEELAAALDSTFPLAELLTIGEEPRVQFFGKKIQVHILDNIRNGHCPEDCGYCAQRKSASAEEIPAYSLKQEEEILKEAEQAYKSGAYRFCLVTSGTGPTEKQTIKYAELVKKIKERFPMRLCLSAGIIKDPKFAEMLAEAGLDRYNHNLNTSAEHTPAIVRTHNFDDRVRTIEHMKRAGVSVCSGVIVGMGESNQDIASVAVRLKELDVPSIPVNFFLPVPGHEIDNLRELSSEFCLRTLAIFRIANPTAEIRVAAGREIYLKDKQAEALRVANSLFVSGYLNVKGSDAAETYSMIRANGYQVDAETSDMDPELCKSGSIDQNAMIDSIEMKTRADLRAFAE
ncbi:MAG: biotin synthase BioB [Spirochaetia bacterium]|nr:biotin synthase BioB [Spirochaetia bacterium]